MDRATARIHALIHEHEALCEAQHATDVGEAEAADLEARRAACVWAMRDVASHDGLVSDAVRRRVWPLLLNVPSGVASERWSGEREGAEGAGSAVVARCTPIPPTPYDDQVEKDVARCLWAIGDRDLEEDERAAKRGLVSRVVRRVLADHPELHYYQGFHDVVVELLVVLRLEEVVLEATRTMALHWIVLYMQPTLAETMQVLNLVFPLLQRVDAPLLAFLEAAGIPPHFAIPWVISLFAHDVVSPPVIHRLWDALLAQHPLFPVYLAVSLLRAARTDIVALDCDFGVVHSFCGKLAETRLTSADEATVLVRRALAMTEAIPPRLLMGMAVDAVTGEASPFPEDSPVARYPYAWMGERGPSRGWWRAVRDWGWRHRWSLAAAAVLGVALYAARHRSPLHTPGLVFW